jgi:hypothetical protein
MSKKTETIEPGLYHDTLRDRYYVRPNINGRRTQRWLKARTRSEAIKEFFKRDHTVSAFSVVQCIDAYLEARTPGRGILARDGDFARGEIYRCGMLKRFFGTLKAEMVNEGHCIAYQKWRVKQLTKDVTGGRAVDMDLGTLSNVFRYCLRLNPPMVDKNPFASRHKFAGQVSHCRDKCPRSGDELHLVAAGLGGILALQFLFEACSGVRTGEALPLRRDASMGEPGYIRTEGGQRYLCIKRVKQGADDPYDYIAVNPAMSMVLRALERYHAGLAKPSVWFFPGRYTSEDVALGRNSLSDALRGVSKRVLPSGRPKLTSHGCRAFYVTWRRCQKVDLLRIAIEIGQRSGVGLILNTYGRSIPIWAQGDFSPWPKKVKPFWGEPEAVVDSTSSTTTVVSTWDISGGTPQHEDEQSTGSIVVCQNDLAHTLTH